MARLMSKNGEFVMDLDTFVDQISSRYANYFLSKNLNPSRINFRANIHMSIYDRFMINWSVENPGDLVLVSDFLFCRKHIPALEMNIEIQMQTVIPVKDVIQAVVHRVIKIWTDAQPKRGDNYPRWWKSESTSDASAHHSKTQDETLFPAWANSRPMSGKIPGIKTETPVLTRFKFDPDSETKIRREVVVVQDGKEYRDDGAVRVAINTEGVMVSDGRKKAVDSGVRF